MDTTRTDHVNKSVTSLPSQEVIDRSLINQKQGQLLQKAIKEQRAGK